MLHVILLKAFAYLGILISLWLHISRRTQRLRIIFKPSGILMIGTSSYSDLRLNTC